MRETTRSESAQKITVDVIELQKMLGVGRIKADEIGEAAGAVIRIGRRKVYSVKAIEAYMEGLREVHNEGETA